MTDWQADSPFYALCRIKGTKKFAEALAKGETDLNLIGQFGKWHVYVHRCALPSNDADPLDPWPPLLYMDMYECMWNHTGVGFYSGFLAADRMTVITKPFQGMSCLPFLSSLSLTHHPSASHYLTSMPHLSNTFTFSFYTAGDDKKQHRWESSAGSSFTVAEDDSEPIEGSGTRIILHLKVWEGGRASSSWHFHDDGGTVSGRRTYPSIYLSIYTHAGGLWWIPWYRQVEDFA